MSTATHPVAPEEVMALIDGELSDSAALEVSTHLDECPACKTLAEEFRQTSRLLSEWSVPTTSTTLEDFVTAVAETAARRRTIDRPRISSHGAHWNRNFWAIGGGGILAVALLSVVVTRTNTRHSMYPAPSKVATEALSYRGDASQVGSQSAAAMRAARALATPQRNQLADSIAAEPEAERQVATEMDSKVRAPMISRTVSLSIVVKNLGDSRKTVDEILALYHAYSADLNASNAENSVRGFVASLRIPASELDAALAEFRGLGRVESESQAGEEVTQQHADLVARLTNSRETEGRLRAILQQRTGSVSDVLKVEEEIARVRGEIEGMEAEQKALEHRVDFATVNLQLNEEFKAQLDFPADSASTRMHNAFVAGYRNASGTLLGMLLFFEEFGPVLLIWIVLLSLPLLLVWRRYRKAYPRD
jgi:anti-sigma factor RsiW